MTTDIVPANSHRPPAKDALQALERVVIEGDLSVLSDQERIAYVARVCESLGLNPLTRPFDYQKLNGKMILYARKDATDQLRQIHGVNIDKLVRERDEALGLYTVTAWVHDRYGRQDEAQGVVSIKGASGEVLANLIMKAETKAKRRATLSICGLGWLDETEVESMRMMEVAPRADIAKGIASRAAALAIESGESEGGDAGATVAEEASDDDAQRATSATGSPAPRPKSRKKADKAPLQPGDAGYGTARAHAAAAERGMDHAAVHRIAADVLRIEEGDLAEFSVKDLEEADWDEVIAAINEAPVVDDASGQLDDLSVAVNFAGSQAINAGLAPDDDPSNPWAKADPIAAEMFEAKEAGELTAAQWREFGIRIYAQNPLP